MKQLSKREEAFVEHYIGGKSASDAARAAGYARSGAASMGAKLTKKDKVKVQIELRRRSVLAAVHDETLFSLEETGREVNALSHSDIKNFFAPNGSMLPLHEIPEHARRAIASYDIEERYEVDEKNPKKTKLILVRTIKVRLWPKVAALELKSRLGGHLKEESTTGGEYILRWADD